MITKLPILKITGGHPYLYDDEDGTEDLFNQSLVEAAEHTLMDPPIYFNEISAYSRWYEFLLPSVDKNIVYDITHNGRFHFLFKGLKYYLNISDLWYMNAMLIGYEGNMTNAIFQKKASAVSLQSFANINLGVDAISLAIQTLPPLGKTINQGLFDKSEVGIRLVLFIDKLDLIERTADEKKIKNLQFHFTIKAYLIDPFRGNQFGDFTDMSFLGQKRFYYEQTIPTYTRAQIALDTAIKTGWGHFIYPVVTTDSTPKSPISYVQLSDALKTIYNGILFSQSTDNDSLKINSSALLSWLRTDTTLKNASSDYEPVAVSPTQFPIPTPNFTEKDVLRFWLAGILNEAALKGNYTANFLLSYDNIYWEPLNDVYNGDIYVNSPAMFMTRLATYYQAPGQSPVDEPGNFENPGGFIKARRKYFLSNLIQRILTATDTYNPIDKNLVSPHLSTPNPEKFLGRKFFPYYKFRQYKDAETNKELLDVITIPFDAEPTVANVIECKTDIELRKVVTDGLNQYRRKIVTKPNALPTSLGSSSIERINAIGFVDYVKDDDTIENIQLNINAVNSKTHVFAFLTWIFAPTSFIGDATQWTRNGRYFTSAKDLRSTSYLGYEVNPWTGQPLCTIMKSGMYDTPEQAYVEHKSVVGTTKITSEPSATDPQWKDYYKCLPTIETTEDTTEYCDPSPSSGGTQIVKRIATQKVSVAANGTKTLVGNPSYTYPSDTVILSGQTRVVNGKNVKGTVTIVYQDCLEVSNTFSPDPIAPPGSAGGTSGPGPNVSISLEDFINPAIFNRNVITLVPSKHPITLQLEKTYYVLGFDPDNVGELLSDYTIRLNPGIRGQVIVLEINTLGTGYKGVILENNSVLANNNTNQGVRLSTGDWGNGGGQPFKSYLFMVYDGIDWVEFLRRDIY